ncbi:MAG TPA: hypothetical protein VII94_04750 [Candidatus Saccharimonadales bacterium]
MEQNHDSSSELTVIDDPFVKLAMVQGKEGFLPVSLHELREALELGSNYPAKQGGAARHLNEILLHQKRADTDDPGRAVRSVANKYVSYYYSSKLLTEQLSDLSDEVREIDNPHLSLEITLGLDRIGLAGMVRFMDLRRVVFKQAVKNQEINPLLTDYIDSPKVETAHYIASVLKDLRVGNIRDVVVLSVKDQENRSKFWRERLVESARHATAKPIVMRALK